MWHLLQTYIYVYFQATFESSKPLPPINQGGLIIEEEEEEEGYEDDTFDTEGGDDCQEVDGANSKSHDTQSGDNFFMTAVSWFVWIF